MPRKTKEQNELDNIKDTTQKIKTAKVSTKSTTSKAKKETPAKKVPAKKTVTKTETKKTTKAVKESTPDKKKTTTSKTAKKGKTKSTSKKTTSKKSTSTAKKSTAKKPRTKKNEVVEYYDLPQRYNETTIKLLAQTPNSLFVYWDISDEDRNNFKKQYGDNFFETTTPILIVHNDTMGYNFEVNINDYANSWYLKVQDSKCDYRIELGRKFIEHASQNDISSNNYVHIYTSNTLENPNDRILFNPNQKMIYFKNTKNNSITKKDISFLSYIENMGNINHIYNIYNIYDLYKNIYNTENLEDLYNLKNPSSAGSQSFTKEFNHE